MPSYTEHIDKARRNIDFFHSINSGGKQSFDWQIIVLYYISVHLVDAHLDRYSIHPTTHTERKEHLSFDGTRTSRITVQAAWDEYLFLEMQSRKFRYDQYRGNPKQLKKSCNSLEVIIRYFDNLYTLNLPVLNVCCEPAHTLNAGNQYVVTAPNPSSLSAVV